ncbi:MAG TPA: PilZ domain-containing protein [Nitrospiraceae bacterium]|nr:PilZ domain-containing protein [Nitrospiraceae bacterium]
MCNSTRRFRRPQGGRDRVTLDLSLDGSRIESRTTVEPGVSLKFSVSVAGFNWPLMIEAASVQWVNAPMFGLAFFQLRETERQRLEQVIRDLRDPPGS